MAKAFDDLIEQTTAPETRRRARRRTRELLSEMLLSEVRKLAGKSQRQLAAALGIRQPSLSKLERQADMQVSTLQRIVRALGGELEVVVRLPTGDVKITQFSKSASKTHRKPHAPSSLGK
ncbi:MAG TPA: helix-turn-helix transcriptional regulator [Planctomycetaceae bacterium]|jgi:transcriptional regulator with XRE-family HTH domain|nr:helix-turn-helix transcriptional regulator [Planctomycetaceae bacterium]